MAGLVIIDNTTNTVRQMGETTTSVLLRSIAYPLFLAGKEQRFERMTKARSKRREDDYFYGTKLGGIDPSQYDDKYRLHTPSIEGYNKYMPFLIDSKPYGNVILGTQDETKIVEFIDAKVRVNKSNTIVETPLTGIKGTVKEYISAQDYSIEIKASLFTGMPGYFPYDEMEALNELLDVPESLKIASKILEIYGVQDVVMESADFDQNEQKFQI